jgi:hypothetical protein
LLKLKKTKELLAREYLRNVWTTTTQEVEEGGPAKAEAAEAADHHHLPERHLHERQSSRVMIQPSRH